MTVVVLALSGNGLAHIACCEKLITTTYADVGGVPTAGYGHTGPDVGNVGDVCTEEQARVWLGQDAATADAAVARMCPAATQAQHDAMVSLAFNIGVRAFFGSEVRAHHMAGDHEKAADAFLNWNHVHGKECDGLTKRRVMDRAIYLGATADEAQKVGEEWLAAKRATEKAHEQLEAAEARVDAMPAAADHPTEPAVAWP